jgi:hypothetical protein
VNVKDELTWYKGNHRIIGGVAYEHKMADNQYMRNGTGYYRYRSLEDFLTGAAPEIVNLTYGYNGEGSPAARVTTNKIGVYGQDEWTINPNFKLTYGIRIDGLFFNNSDLRPIRVFSILIRRSSHDTASGLANLISRRVWANLDVLATRPSRCVAVRALRWQPALVFFTNMLPTAVWCSIRQG